MARVTRVIDGLEFEAGPAINLVIAFPVSNDEDAPAARVRPQHGLGKIAILVEDLLAIGFEELWIEIVLAWERREVVGGEHHHGEVFYGESAGVRLAREKAFEGGPALSAAERRQRVGTPGCRRQQQPDGMEAGAVERRDTVGQAVRGAPVREPVPDNDARLQFMFGKEGVPGLQGKEKGKGGADQAGRPRKTMVCPTVEKTQCLRRASHSATT